MSSEVNVIKLTTGEEVICRCTVGSDEVLLKRPHTIMQVPGPNGQVGIALVPWIMAGNDEDISIPTRHVLAQVSSKRELADMYLQQVTGLSLASTDTSQIKL